MVNGIDASTGIPLDDSSMIQQIPLGGQVFPFSDWDASARPTRNPIYGDDILPTSALVAGQLPTQDAAQSVHTDGNHALLVSDVGGGGGGSLPIIVAKDPEFFVLSSDYFNGDPNAGWTHRYLLGISIAFALVPGPAAGTAFNVKFSVVGTTSARGFGIWSVAMQSRTTDNGSVSDSITIAYPYMIDLYTSCNDTAFKLLWSDTSGGSDGGISISLLCAD